MIPPLAGYLLVELRRILERENGAGRGGVRWAARLVLERRVTYILVVSDSALPNARAELAIEQELARLRAAYQRTAPAAISSAGEGNGSAPPSPKGPFDSPI